MAERPMDVIGQSFGAATALRLAVARPDLVRSLTVFEPVFFAAARWHDPQALGGDDLPDADYIEALKEGDRTRAARLFNGMWGDEGPGWNSLSERTQAAMARAVHVVPDTRAFLYDDTAGLLKPGGLDALPMPCVVMRGEHTQDAVVATNDALERIIPGARQAVIEGAGHMAPITHPDAVAAELQELLVRS
ncbi:MAG: alpha/beta hydrolase, partial [Sulfitobacter sp.]|nr:alpha/beta hydrolase [Sulfitobacter sp.]